VRTKTCVLFAFGTRGAYFVCALVSENPRNAVTNAVGKRIGLDRPLERADGEPPTRDSMLGRVVLGLALGAGRASQRFRLYAGPNETSALREWTSGMSNQRFDRPRPHVAHEVLRRPVGSRDRDHAHDRDRARSPDLVQDAVPCSGTVSASRRSNCC
jgi:hypothetical protein